MLHVSSHGSLRVGSVSSETVSEAARHDFKRKQ
jgi:hypothetical protein